MNGKRHEGREIDNKIMVGLPLFPIESQHDHVQKATEGESQRDMISDHVPGKADLLQNQRK